MSMYNNGYTPPTQPQRHRRSERHAQQNAGASSSRTDWNQADWNSQQPVRQQYQPAATPARQPRASKGKQQPKPNYLPYSYQEQPQQQYQQKGYQPQQPQQGYGRGYYPQQQTWPAGGSGGNQPPKKGNPLRTVLIALLCLALLAGAGYGGYLALQEHQVRQYVATYDNYFCQGVYVDGIHLGGMTADQGIAAVQAKAQQRNDAWSVQLTYQGQQVTQINASHLNMTVDVMDVLATAWQQGHTGDIHQRKADMEALQTQPYEAYTANPGGDTSVIDDLLDAIRNSIYRAPQDARIVSFDPEKTADPFTFQEAVDGRRLDTEPIKQELYRMVSTMESGSIELKPTIIPAQVTVADLRKTVALRGTAYTKISTMSTEDRNKNIVRSCQLISGTIIQPGETFSFNGVVGKRTVENGFFTAIEYANGEHVEGIGGGVCQTSSTVYLAAVNAGMEIVKREPHSDQVNYTDYGKDATVYWEYGRKIDFVFRNNTEGPIYMVAKVQSDPNNKKRLITKVSIYGMDLGNVSYGLETQTVEVLQPGEDKIIKDKKGQYVTYTDEQHVERQAAEGYVVDSYRIKYVDGNEVERTKLYTDTYKAKEKRIYVGVTERPIQ